MHDVGEHEQGQHGGERESDVHPPPQAGTDVSHLLGADGHGT